MNLFSSIVNLKIRLLKSSAEEEMFRKSILTVSVAGALKFSV